MKRKSLLNFFVFLVIGFFVVFLPIVHAETLDIEGITFTKNADGTLTKDGRTFTYINKNLRYIISESEKPGAAIVNNSIVYKDSNDSLHYIAKDGKDYVYDRIKKTYENGGAVYILNPDGSFSPAPNADGMITDPTTGKSYYDISPNKDTAPSLIPCGRSGQPRCTLCHFVVGFKGLIDFGMSIVVYLALTAVFVSGILYILAFTDEGMVKMAKDMLRGTLVGFAFIMTGWLIVNVTLWVLSANVDMGQEKTKVWYEITCDTTASSFTSGATTSN